MLVPARWSGLRSRGEGGGQQNLQSNHFFLFIYFQDVLGDLRVPGEVSGIREGVDLTRVPQGAGNEPRWVVGEWAWLGRGRGREGPLPCCPLAGGGARGGLHLGSLPLPVCLAVPSCLGRAAHHGVGGRVGCPAAPRGCRMGAI